MIIVEMSYTKFIKIIYVTIMISLGTLVQNAGAKNLKKFAWINIVVKPI